jgi:hypothetical protein
LSSTFPLLTPETKTKGKKMIDTFSISVIFISFVVSGMAFAGLAME